MAKPFKKLIRTGQSYFPAVAGLKVTATRGLRRVLGRPHERDFEALKAIRLDDVEVMVDIGANHGQSIESMRLFNKAAPIVAFEPNPSLARQLERRCARRDDVRIVGEGLADEPGRLSLMVPVYRGYVYDGLASMNGEEAAGWLSAKTIYGFDRSKLTLTPYDCPVGRLDDFNFRAGAIKIDVQNFEIQVLRGAVQTLRRTHPALMIETPGQAISELLAELGYSPFNWTGRALTAGIAKNTWFLTPSRTA